MRVLLICIFPLGGLRRQANGAFQMAESYYQLGQNEKANKIIDELANKSLEYMIWYLSLNDNQLAIASECLVLLTFFDKLSYELREDTAVRVAHTHHVLVDVDTRPTILRHSLSLGTVWNTWKDKTNISLSVRK